MIDKYNALRIAYDVIKTEAGAVSEAARYMDEDEFMKAVTAITSAPLVITTACGTSGMAAMKFAHLLCCIERTARFLSPAEATHGGLGCVQAGSVVVLVSKGGNTSELSSIVEVSKKRGAILIAVTENTNSYLAQQSDIVLRSNTVCEVGRYNILSTSSFLVSVAILDALICVLMETTNFNTESFSLIHPGGAVGLQLNSLEK